MKSLVTAANYRIDTKVFLFNIPLNPRVVVGAASVLITRGIYPVINGVGHLKPVPRFFDNALKFLKGRRVVQPLEQGIQS